MFSFLIEGSLVNTSGHKSYLHSLCFLFLPGLSRSILVVLGLGHVSAAWPLASTVLLQV